jgi:enterochelin esterase-like enzyme
VIIVGTLFATTLLLKIQEMKKLAIFIFPVIFLAIDLYSQQGNPSGLILYKNIVYTSRGNPILLMDIYLPSTKPASAGIGIAQEEPLKLSNGINRPKWPVLIWIPGSLSNKFPTPVAAYTGNGYAVVSLQIDKESEKTVNIDNAVTFLNTYAEIYHIDAGHIGIIHPDKTGYEAVIWNKNLRLSNSLSEAKIKTRFIAREDFNFSMLQSEECTNVLLGFFDKNLRKGQHVKSDPLSLSCPPDSWVDPVTNPIPNTTYHLFATRVRGQNTHGSYLLYLPADYDISNKKYPVIYWLHGGNGNSREGNWMCARMNDAMKKGEMPKSIIVFVQGLPVGWYNNSKDGSMPVEDVIIRDLIPHIDSTYRTFTSAEARGIEGMSMGGYGSLHLGFKYPELFGVVSSIAPSITTFEMERKEIIAPVFENDTLYFNMNSPAELARKNAGYIMKNTSIRLLVGDKDFLFDLINNFSLLLDDLKISHKYSIARGADHDYRQVIEKLDSDPFTFWRDAFKPFE